MIQMRFHRGGVIDVPPQPALISLLLVHGFSQIEGRPANAAEAVFTGSHNGEVERVPAEAEAIAERIRAGSRLEKLELASRTLPKEEQADAR